MRDHLFVYGTLMPGHLRWWMLEEVVVDERQATAPGTLYDTGHGWPAAVFGTGPGIPGWLIEVEVPSALELGRLLRRLDAMEGIGEDPDPVSDPYVRRRIEVEGVEAWAYDATGVPAGWQAVASWGDREER
ncbi:MAG: gamma-glutamylcyclotransferase family protein [Acidimicrobiales bacterium]